MGLLLGTGIFWRLTKAATLLVGLMLSVALTPGAMAHGIDYQEAVRFSAASNAQSDATRPAAGGTAIEVVAYVQSASWKLAGTDEPCSNGPCHNCADDLVCCCAMMTSCAMHGAMILPAGLSDRPPAEARMPLLTMAVPASADIALSDPPPRASI